MMGKAVSNDTLYRLVLCMEQLMSTGGGWQDQAGGLTGGITGSTPFNLIAAFTTVPPCSRQ